MTTDARLTRTWPLPRDLTAARAAREHVGAFVGDAGLGGDMEDTLTLVASELAVNAIRHGSGGATLLLEVVEGGVRVSVHGESATSDPMLGHADASATSGRGLAIVASLARDWGWSRDGDQVTVWALVGS